MVPYPPTGRGVLQRSYNLVRELAREHRVFLLGLVQPRLLRDPFGDQQRGLTEAVPHLKQFCEEVEFLPIPSEEIRYGRHLLAAKSLVTTDPYSVNWLKSRPMMRVARSWKERYHFDVVHFDTIGLGPYHSLFSAYPTTLDHHNIESHMMRRRAGQEPNPLKRAYFWQEAKRLARYEGRVCPKFNLHITCSALDSARLLEQVPGLSVSEIPNGVDVNYFQPDGNATLPDSLVFAGNLSWYPNAAAMLFFAKHVWPLLRAAVPNVTMNVVGAAPPRKLVDLAKADPNFKLPGFVPDVRPYLNRAAVYVCPITDGGGTKLKVLDALAMGKPLVSHPVACEGIDVQEGATVLFARKPQEFVRHIIALFDDAKRRQAMGSAARQLAERLYSYSSIGRKLREVMTECLAKSAAVASAKGAGVLEKELR
ncbi:MAG: glycosyltransferase family 4 protein [Gammaproteobacteria bacterium]|nr:glycosyltransferase family 4 protein [Gammaproteobacteria bacterium]